MHVYFNSICDTEAYMYLPSICCVTVMLTWMWCRMLKKIYRLHKKCRVKTFYIIFYEDFGFTKAAFVNSLFSSQYFHNLCTVQRRAKDVTNEFLLIYIHAMIKTYQIILRNRINNSNSINFIHWFCLYSVYHLIFNAKKKRFNRMISTIKQIKIDRQIVIFNSSFFRNDAALCVYF